ncbi:MAG: malectin domain-containing carbohydrate-binding protein, partial [Angustibacter sp.]
TTGGSAPTQLPFDLVGPWPSANAQVWVKVPALAAGASTTACLYFANPGAAALPANPSARYDPLYRVRGGATTTIADPAKNWVPDVPSPAGLTVNTGNAYTNAQPIVLDASVPLGTPAALFTTERWDDTGNPELRYRFTVAAGRPVRVRLLESEIYFTSVGQRIFSVNIEGGTQEITKLDPYATCLARGLIGSCGLAFDYAYPSSVDGFIDIDFIHVTQNPKVAAIEILDETVLAATGGALESLSAVGTWTSAVVDTGGPGVYGLTSANLTLAAGTSLTYQVATSASASGPWQYVGPDGTAATSYSGPAQPLA